MSDLLPTSKRRLRCLVLAPEQGQHMTLLRSSIMTWRMLRKRTMKDLLSIVATILKFPFGSIWPAVSHNNRTVLA